MIEYEPLQIVAALPGWRAVYKQDDGSEVEDAIACWAVANQSSGDKKGPPSKVVIGMVPGEFGWLEPACDVSNFVGYRGPDMPPVDG